ncbi:serine/threonine-protein kinase [Modestobacter italicus]|uniref:serine/threonine-protein kinase n=1 Tax=Modestobacter italicus (strain DSM 44449 / CECT 9708 / BC 501) TaxID=2732864 RepID=UPI00141338C3|nr:serine/threonine-protein kinase [Modestobacter marinus]
MAGRYLLSRRLGGGAMGAVWLARDELLGRDVAVKQVLIPVGSDPEATAGHRDAAMREGRIAARITHPHAVSVYDMVDDGGTPWLVMEYLPSRSLAQVLADRGTLPVQQVAQIGAQVADALIATHAAGVVHRDVKPGNILIGEGGRSEGQVKITDFGISRARGDVSLTQTGVVKGTPAYLAPEVARGQEPDEASDVYSLGATLFACLEGTPPFGMTENPLEMLYRVAGGEFTRPRNAGALTRPLMRMLDSDPAQRPSMTEVRDELATLAAGRDRDVTAVLTARTPLPSTLTDGHPVGARVLPAVPAAGTPATPAGTPAATAVQAVAPAPAQPAPAPSPPAGPPADRTPAAAPAPAPRRRRRGRLIALAAALVAALLVGLVVVWQLGRDDDRTPTADPTSSSAPASEPTATPSPTPSAASSSAPSTSESAPSTPPSTPAPSTTPPPSSDDAEQGSAAEVRQAITSYYALLPQDPQSAWDLTGPTLRGAESRGNYIAFWNRFDSVTLGPVSATDGSLTASAPVTYVENGSTLPEQHTFVLVRGEDGQLLIDSDRAG